MRMISPFHQQSTRLVSPSTIRVIRLGALLGFVAIAIVAFSLNPSAAGSLGQTLFSKAVTMITGGPTLEDKSPEIPAARVNSTFTSALAEAAPQSPSSAMTIERHGHTATRLADGRVLIVGGENSGGGYLSEAGIFDPAAGTFSIVGYMGVGRSDHGAVKLADGKVLISGGHNATGTTNTTEIFDPTSGAFLSGPAMSVARAGHSATLLADERVLIAGGDGNGSAEILDPLLLPLGTFSAVGGSLNTGRSMHSAALLNDGRVLLVGGSDADGNALDTAEIFDPADPGFSVASGLLTVPRVLPHLRVLFDGKVQIIGGSSDSSMEIYDPVIETIGAYAHVLPETDPCPNLVNHILSSQTRAALFHNGQSDPVRDRSGHTITELPESNRALVLGGRNSSGTVLSSASILNSSAATITTDKLDYAPGETVNISGRGWQPGETVRIMIHEDPHTPQERGSDVQADANGNITGTYLVQDYDLEMSFIVGARGLTSGWTAQTTFTDGTSNLDIAPAWYSTNPGAVRFSALVRITAPPNNNRQCVRLVVPAGYTSVTLESFSVGVAGWTSVVNGNVIRLSGATALVPGAATAWARFNVLATPPAAATSAAWVAQIGNNTLAISDCTGGLNSDNAVIRIGAILPRVFKADFRDSGGVVIPSETGTAGVSKEYRLRISNTSGGGGDDALYATIALPPCFSAPTGVTVTTSNGGDPDFNAVLTDNFIRLTGGKLKKDINPDDYVEVKFTTTPQQGCSSVFQTTLWKDIEHHPNDIAHVFSHQGDHPSVTVAAACTSPSVTTNPTDQTVVSGQDATFTAAASGSPAPTVQWQISTDGGANFNDIPGATNTTLTVTAPTTAQNGNKYRAVFTNTCTPSTATTTAATLTVNKGDTTTTITADNPDPSVVGQSYQVDVTVAPLAPASGTPSGTVAVDDGSGNTCTITLAAGSGSCSLTSTSAGAKTITASYSGDSNFNTSSDTETHQVNKANTTTTITSDSPDPSVVGQAVPVNYSVTVDAPGSGTPTGNVTVTASTGETCTGTVAAGTCSISFTSAGPRTLTAAYAGDTNFNGSTSTAEPHQVDKADTTTMITSDSPDPSVVGQAVPINYSVTVNSPGSGTPTGNVTVTATTGETCTGTVAAGTCSITFTSAGPRTLTATYAGDTNFNGSTSVTEPHQVDKANTTTTITSDSPEPSVVGQAVMINYSVTVDAPGSGTPTGNVTITASTGETCTGTVAAGTCSIAFTSAGPRTLTATYAGDTNFNGSTSAAEPHQVDKANTTTTITSDSPDPSVVGQAVTINYSVTVDAPGSGTPTGNVTVTASTGETCTGTVAAGTCSISFASAGARTLTAAYTGDTNFNSSTSAAEPHQVDKGDTATTITADNPDPSVVGQSYQVDVTVAPVAPASGTPSGTVAVDDGNGNTCTITLTGGSGSCSLTSTSAGPKTITASYAGDANFNTSNDTETHQVDKGDTATTITADNPDPSVVGQSYQVDVTVAPVAPASGTPSGTVAVDDGNGNTCTITLAAGSGSCSLTSTSAGPKTITASYAGDANFNTSNDTETHQVDKGDTTTTITADNPDPSVVGQSYQVDVTVAPVAPATGVPSGTVAVDDGNGNTCTITLAAGSGSCALTSTSAGPKTITASYAGDSNFNTSGDTEAHQVDKGDTTTTITADNPDPSVVGQSYQVDVTVAPVAPATGVPSGTVAVDDGNGNTCTITLTGGSGSCSLTSTSAGPKTITASYAGDANFNISSDTETHQVDKRATTTTLVSSPNPSNCSDEVTFTATVMGTGPGAGDPGNQGTVQFKIDGANFGAPVPLSDNQASTSTSTLTSGTHTVEATYSGGADFNESTSGETTITVLCPDIVVTKSPDMAAVTATDNIGFTITVSNTGPGLAKNVMLTDTLPTNPGLSWTINGGTGAGSCSINAGVLECNYGNMASGANKSVHISSPTTPDTCGTVSNTANATVDNEESQTLANNTSMASITVNCPDVTVTKTADSATVNAGSPIGFTITVTNTGAGTAKSVTLTDSLPTNPGMTWTEVPDSPDCSINPSGVLTCNFGNLAPSDSRLVHVTSPTTPANCGSVSNTATASATNERSSDTGNNSSTATIVLTDVTAPVITLNPNTAITLWSPNHKYTNVKVTDLIASVSDSCNTTISLGSVYISQVTSDEPENINSGDGNTFKDMVIANDCKSVDLRAERDGSKNGRVYTITFKVKDIAGNVGTTTAKVTVPHSKGPKGTAIDDGPVYIVNSSNCP